MGGWALLAALAGVLAAPVAIAQNFPITPGQRSTAEQVAQAGVPLSELAPNAPEEYTVKRGDTLWAISGMFLTKPWRWPELWGMNMSDIQNPHRIYPGQHLVLEKHDGRARCACGRSRRALCRWRPSGFRHVPAIDALADAALPTLNTHLIEAFLAEPVIIDEAELLQAPRIVAHRR